jgi:hypothetical protein
MSLFPLAPFSVPAFEFWILRAFRNADRLTTFKIFRRPGAFDDVSLQVNRGDRIGLAAKAKYELKRKK